VKKWERFFIGGTAALAFLVLWEIAAPMGWINDSYISRPSEVVKAFIGLAASGEILHHLGVSLKEFAFGFALACLVGIPAGIVFGRYRTLTLLFDPLLMALYTMPRLAMMPLLVVWFGAGLGSTTAVVFLGVVFPVLVNTAVGIREVDPVWIRAVQSFGGGEWDVFTKVLLPGAVPPLMTGIRLGVGRGILGVVVSEMYAGTEGLGHQIDLYGNAFRIAELVALIAIISILGFVAVNLVRLVEERVRSWGAEATA